METRSLFLLPPCRGPLETSLVEWKRAAMQSTPPFSSSLETSLVEWKQRAYDSVNIDAFNLGNFLSGMETDDVISIVNDTDDPWKLP